MYLYHCLKIEISILSMNVLDRMKKKKHNSDDIEHDFAITFSKIWKIKKEPKQMGW